MTENRPVHFEAPSLIARRWYEVHAYPRGNRLEVYARDIHDRKLVELELRKARDILEQRVTERTAELSREIALRTEAETTMRESLREVQDLYDHAPCGYHSLDDTGRYLRVNDTELAMLGYERSAVIGRPFVDFVVLESKPIFERAFQTLLQRGTVNDVELQMARRDGASFTISFNAIAKYDAAGRFQICRGSGVDITERKRAEERARQLQQDLANIGRLILVGELAAGLAHELNQPLTAVANYARGCARMIRAGNVTPDQLLRGVEQAAEQAERAAEVIRRLRAFFTRRTLHYAATNLNDLVREAVGLLDHDIRQAEVRLQLDLDPRLPAVSVDSIAIVQVVLNLARNAVEAMSGLPPSRRSLTISTSQSEAGKVRLAVADVGPGIAPAIRDRLFEPFQTTKPEGMGLGLVISRSIIEAHGGQLEWDAAATVGTTFSLTLPRSPTR
jgi:PAS domain S-box-containing protein